MAGDFDWITDMVILSGWVLEIFELLYILLWFDLSCSQALWRPFDLFFYISFVRVWISRFWHSPPKKYSDAMEVTTLMPI